MTMPQCEPYWAFDVTDESNISSHARQWLLQRNECAATDEPKPARPAITIDHHADPE